MSDQCKYCICRGKLKQCLDTDCNQHESWMVGEIKRQYKNEVVMQNMLLDSIQRIIDGKEVSDFELSFPIIQSVADLKNKEQP